MGESVLAKYIIYNKGLFFSPLLLLHVGNRVPYFFFIYQPNSQHYFTLHHLHPILMKNKKKKSEHICFISLNKSTHRQRQA